MTKAKMSVCLIVRDDAGSGLLEECLRSVRDHVEEIVVVDTGSTDETPEIAKRYADRFEVFAGCNDPATGLIENFSVARKRSFELASRPWRMWMDSDDVLAGPENLAKLLAFADERRGDNAWCYLFPYEYAYNDRGECTCLHYRERLVSDNEAMEWRNPVHEVLIPTGKRSITMAPSELVVFKHQRHRSKKGTESGRNLRILKKLVEDDGTDDARHFYYLGLEYTSAGNLDKAVEWLTKYVGLSGWDDEKTMACLKLVEIAYARNDLAEGIRWAFRAIETRETWGEGYFALACGFYGLAIQGGPAARRNWERCSYFARAGLALPPTRTLLFINPLERDYEIHCFLNMALNQLGDVEGALRSAEEGLKRHPDDANLLNNRKLYVAHLARVRAVDAMNVLRNLGELKPDACDRMNAILHKQVDLGAEAWAPSRRPAGYPRGVEEADFPVARVTPHGQAWGIPEAHDHVDLPVRMTDAQLQSATLLVWKELMLHDEILAAERFLLDAPYRVKHTAATARALAMTRRTTAWMDSEATTQTTNQPENTEIENGIALPGPLTGALKARADLAVATVKKGDRVVDFGCFDGGLTNRWALAGHDVTGVDVCRSSVAMANRKAKEFATGARHVASYFRDAPDLGLGAFDAVTCCDTYEHVRDPVEDLLRPAHRMLGDGGQVTVVTPHGAWLRGAFLRWAHPWRWADDLGKPWLCDENRAHLVAPTVWTVAENLRSAGFWVETSRVAHCEVQDVPGQGHVYAVGRKRPPTPDGLPLDVVVACGDCLEDWTPETARTRGIGGSETAVVEVARRLARLGHRVRVFTSTGPEGEGIYDGVEYRQSAHLALAGSCDVLVAWRHAQLLEAPIEAHARVLWVHDVWALGANHRNLLRADKVLALSQWHRSMLATYHNVHPLHVERTRNGVDLARFEAKVERNPHKVVYSSSPDRGLQALLDVWPKVREAVPDAELHVFYGFFNWRRVAELSGDANALKVIAMLEGRLAGLADRGVHVRGRVDQATLAREFLSAGAWAYSTWFAETSCITAMEAQAAGLRIVTSPIAALAETVGERGTMIEGDWLSPGYQERFAAALVDALTRPEDGDRERLRGHAREHFSWDVVARDWSAMFRDLLAKVSEDPLVPYQPARGFGR